MFDFQLIVDSLPLLFQGACVTVQITAISVGLGLFFGLFIGIAQISRVAFFRIPGLFARHAALGPDLHDLLCLAAFNRNPN